jgi:hypothetical protein
VLGLKHFANLCGKAHTTQVFSFFGAALWFISFVGGLLIWAETRWAIRRATEAAAPAEDAALAGYACVSDITGMWLMSYRHHRCFEMTRL